MLRNLWLVLVTVGLASLVRAEDARVATVPQSVGPSVLERLARKVEPDLVGRQERVQQYVDFFRSEIGNDKRLVAFEVATKASRDGQVELRGFIEFPETRAALTRFLDILGFAVEDTLETLPAAELGEKIFGLLKSSHSLSYDRPSGRRTSETDCLLGEPVYLLREEDGHLLVHSGDGYLGYVRKADVLRRCVGFFSLLERTTRSHRIGSQSRSRADGSSRCSAQKDQHEWRKSDRRVADGRIRDVAGGIVRSSQRTGCRNRRHHRKRPTIAWNSVPVGRPDVGGSRLLGSRANRICHGGTPFAAGFVPAVLSRPIDGHALAHRGNAARRHAVFPRR